MVVTSGSATIHASAVLVGARAVLIRGRSGAGKSRLALALLEIRHGMSERHFTRLVGDDRVHLVAAGGRLLVSPAAPLAGLIEMRGTGILRFDYEPCAVVGLVVDLQATDAEQLPEKRQIELEGIKLPWLAVAPGVEALPGVLAGLARSDTAISWNLDARLLPVA